MKCFFQFIISSFVSQQMTRLGSALRCFILMWTLNYSINFLVKINFSNLKEKRNTVINVICWQFLLLLFLVFSIIITVIIIMYHCYYYYYYHYLYYCYLSLSLLLFVVVTVAGVIIFIIIIFTNNLSLLLHIPSPWVLYHLWRERERERERERLSYPWSSSLSPQLNHWGIVVCVIETSNGTFHTVLVHKTGSAFKCKLLRIVETYSSTTKGDTVLSSWAA